MAARRIRTLVANLSLLLVSLAVSCAAGEAYLRFFSPRPLDTGYIWPDGTHRHRPSTRLVYSRGEFSNPVTYNAIGMRGPEVAPGKDPDRPRLVFLGDSFVEGKHVADDEVLTARIADLSRAGGRPLEVINMGVAGYGTGEELFLWKNFARTLQPDIVLLGFYANDVRNNAERGLYALRDGRLVQRKPMRVPRKRWKYEIRKYLASQFHLSVMIEDAMDRLEGPGEEDADEGAPEDIDVFARDPSPKVARGWDLTLALLDDLASGVREEGAAFGVVVFPTRYQVDGERWRRLAGEARVDPADFDLETPERRLADWSARSGVPVVALLPDFRSRSTNNGFYFEVDGHWRAAGHEMAAEVIWRELESGALAGLLPAAPASNSSGQLDP